MAAGATPTPRATPGPAATPAPAAWEPFRFLFPIGALYAVLGTSPWLWALRPGAPYPGTLHSILMIQGFELAFISGFLLTVMPRLTRSSVLDRRELPWVIAALAGFGVAAFLGQATVAHAFAAANLLLLATAVVRRLVARRNDPPEEIVFVPFGLVLGLAGVLVQLAASTGAWTEPSYRLGLRLLSLGMVLSFVLGFGALLVPVFLEIKDPLVIPKVARPHQRPPRRVLYGALAAALALTFVADAWGAPAVAAYARAIVGTIMLALVWKIARVPGRRTLPAFAMWISGWLVGVGLWLAALDRAHEIGAMHVTLIGGFGVLTMAIASRVVVTHGGYGPAAEAKVLVPAGAVLLALALVARLVAEFDTSRMPLWLAAGAVAWIAAWSLWLARAARYLTR